RHPAIHCSIVDNLFTRVKRGRLQNFSYGLRRPLAERKPPVSDRFHRGCRNAETMAWYWSGPAGGGGVGDVVRLRCHCEQRSVERELGRVHRYRLIVLEGLGHLGAAEGLV